MSDGDDPETCQQDSGQNPPPEEGSGSECPGPHVEAEEETGDEEEPPYPIFPDQAERTHDDSRGTFHVFARPSANTNSTDRPIPPRFLIRNSSELQRFPGAGGTGLLHPAMHDALQRMLDAMQAEGERVNDASLKNVEVQSPWRDPAVEGRNYLRTLKTHLGLHSDCHQNGNGCVAGERHSGYRDSSRHCPSGFQNCRFPASLEAEARSELGRSGSSAHQEFQRHLGDAPGWTQAFARYLVTRVRSYKAPAGGTPHHSGLVVDLDWPYYDTGARRVQNVDTTSARNAEARRSGAGVWINAHARSFGFSSYDESKEIWHLEWLDWAGTSADPG